MSNENIVPNIQRQRIIEYLKQGKRFDGRDLGDFREISVKMNISNKSEGSCSVKFGKTEVYCGVKLDIAEPYPDSLDEGTLVTTVELSPIASPDFETGPPRINAIEMARIVDRGIRESGFIDFKKLCIKEGEKVWQIYVDIYAINDDGNLIDVASLAALIALGNAKFPFYDPKKEKIDREKPLTKDPLPLNKDAVSFNITFHRIGNRIILDASKEEEEISDFRISFAVSDNKGEPRISSIQKGKGAAISEEEIEKILNIIEDKFKKMLSEIKGYIFEK